MKRLWILFLGIVALSTNAKAEDSVYVDMSVLNSLGNAQVVSESQPMFPVVKKQPRKPKKASPAPAKSTPTQKKLPVVVHKAEVKPAIVVEEKVEKTAEVIEIPERIMDAPALVESTNDEPKVEPTQVEPVAREDIEPLEPEHAPAPSMDVVPNRSSVVFQNSQQESAELSVIQGENDEETALSEQDAELLTPPDDDTIEGVELKDNKIYFAAEDASLNDVKKSLIDNIISKFGDANNNKIAILSYNYDNGEDSFRKKRLSLNRAVEIRSYLLGKGYKNFSIKVINVTDDITKNGLVEIEELI